MQMLHPCPMDVLAAARCFVAVTRRRSFSEAAGEQGITQPALSRRIAALERHLDGALFERTSRHVEPTPLGVAVLGRARALLEAEEAFTAAAAAHQQGVLRLVVPPDLDAAAWAAVVLYGQAADQRLVLAEADRERRTSMVRDGEADIAVLAVGSARADWTVELGLGHHPQDDGGLRGLRPVRGDDRRARVLILSEDSAPDVVLGVRSACVRLGLSAGQVQPAPSLVQALAEVIAGDARVLCTASQAQRWGLGWRPTAEFDVRRHYRLDAVRPSVADALRPVLHAPIGEALGVTVSR